MRAYVAVVCVLAVSTLVLSIPRPKRQIDSSSADIDDLSGWVWNPPNRPTRPTRPTRPPRPIPETPPTNGIPVPTRPPAQGSTPPSGPSQAALWRCMQTCLRTPQYDPECASLQDGTKKTYANGSERMCAEFCGESSTFLFRGNCQALL